MSIVINKPQAWIDRDKALKSYWHIDIEEFYNRLERLVKEYPCSKDIFINYHGKGGDNIWHIKKGYVPGYLYFDKYGYSGWSELAKSYTPSLITVKDIDNVDKICNYYIDNNISKAAQPDKDVTPKKPYILVTGQLITDTVSSFAYIKCNVLPSLIQKVYKNTKYDVIFKAHPLDKVYYPNAVEGSIHSLIKDASAVFTVNSGTGFEALMHGKHVFTAGDCDYKWATVTIKSEQDIIDSISIIEQSVPYVELATFLHHAFTEHFVDVSDDNSIRRKLQRVVDET